jgi:glutamyl-tRNA reductase
MALILLGLNHRTTPLDLRERLSFSPDQLGAALSDLHNNYLLVTEETTDKKHSSEPLCEVLILSTCNRLEIYAVVHEKQQGWNAIEQFLMQQGSFRWGSLDEHFYRLADHDVVTHLMRVASGLDSMILGEPQIIGQVSEAFNAAQQARTTGAVLSHLLAEVLHAGKRVYTETPISRHTTSASHAALQLIQTKVEDLASAQVLILGAGEIATQAARALRMHHVESITCINRTQTRAVDLAEEIQGKALPWKALPQALGRADVLISTTGAPGVLLNRAAIQATLNQRRGRKLTIVDLAVPRDIEPAVAELPGVYLYNIDDLQATLDKNLALRQAAIPQVEAILKERAESFLSWLQSRQVIPVLTSFRSKVSTLAEAEIKLALNRMEGLNQQSQDAVVRAVHRIVNKMLHEPTERLKAHAAAGEGLIYAQVLQDLFALDASLTSVEQIDYSHSHLR